MVLERVPDRDILQGTWTAVALEMAGQIAPEVAVKDKRFLFDGDRFCTTGQPEDLKTYRLDSSTSPKHGKNALRRCLWVFR